MNKYESKFIDTASKLDAISDSTGEITKFALLIVEKKDKKSTIKLLQGISKLIKDSEARIEVKKIAQTLQKELIEVYGYSTLQDICKAESDEIDKRSFEELINELNSLIGLKNVKEKVNDLIAYQKVQKLRQENNLINSKSTLHLAFTGKPGTGKTTVARIIGHIYKKIGLLSKGHFLEVSRTDLIAGYQGQTALKVKEIIDRAKGGVLFIDEAYSITENNHSDSYGRECLTELTKALEDYRDDLVVIVAGYTQPMKKFFESNPGLKSRFNTFIEFPDYEVNELKEILEAMCKKNDYILDSSIEMEIEGYLDRCISEKGENFANGRLIRNLYDNLVINHAKRVVKIKNPSRDQLIRIIKEDFYVLRLKS